MNRYILNNSIELDLRFTDIDGDLIDPDSIDGMLRLPDNSKIDLPSAIRIGIGIYTITFTPPVVGYYVYKITATFGTHEAATENNFSVLSNF